MPASAGPERRLGKSEPPLAADMREGALEPGRFGPYPCSASNADRSPVDRRPHGPLRPIHLSDANLPQSTALGRRESSVPGAMHNQQGSLLAPAIRELSGGGSASVVLSPCPVTAPLFKRIDAARFPVINSLSQKVVWAFRPELKRHVDTGPSDGLPKRSVSAAVATPAALERAASISSPDWPMRSATVLIRLWASV